MWRQVGSTLAVAGLVVAGLQARGDETFGKGVTLKEATPIKKLYDTPAAFVGKTVRIDGVVSAVCEEMGCWMALADLADAAKVVRFKVDHGAGIAFPITAKGKAATAEGVFEKIAAGDKEAHEAAAEHASHAAHTGQAGGPAAALDFGKLYQIKLTGAIVK
jgi:hypothetical protein